MGGNHERALVTRDVEGTEYRFQMSINGMCEIEAVLSVGGKRVSYNTFIRDLLPEGRWTEYRLFMWAALREHHPDMTIPKAAWIMDRIGWQESILMAAEIAWGTRPDVEDL